MLFKVVDDVHSIDSAIILSTPLAADLKLSRRHVDQFVAVKDVLGLGAVEVALPGRNDDGGDAVADQIAERARHADEPVDRQHQHEPDRRDARHCIERGGENDDG
jgi:hypothetical protein